MDIFALRLQVVEDYRTFSGSFVSPRAWVALLGAGVEPVWERLLGEQEADLRRLQQSYPASLVVWAGDFNQSVTGPNLTGSANGRTDLSAAQS